MKQADYSLWLQPRRSRVLEWLSAVVVLLAITCAVWLAGEIVAMSDEQSAIEERTRQLQERKTALGRKSPSKADREAEQQLDQLKADIAYPWEVLLLGLERTSQNNIELREFVPDRQAKSVTLSGEALSIQDLSNFIEALSRQPGFESIYLVNQKASARSGVKTVIFQLKANLGA